MVEIFAIIRPQSLTETKDKLVEIGYPAFTCIQAKGRGKKPVDFLLADGTQIRTSLVSKRVLILVVPRSVHKEVIKAIMSVNSTGNPGDGKIFVSQVEKTYRVRSRALIESE
ncbi:MAG: P-II family nitrogen regulator [Eubacteriales bacterium]